MTLLPTLGFPTSAMRSGCALSRSSAVGVNSAIAWGQDMAASKARAGPASGERNRPFSARNPQPLADSRQPVGISPGRTEDNSALSTPQRRNAQRRNAQRPTPKTSKEANEPA